jgi:hypothetical protein
MLSKSIAGILLGAPLSAAALGVVLWLWPGHWESAVIPVLVFFFPVWVAVMALAYLFRTAPRAWAWLGAANIAAFGLVWLVRDVVGVI